MGGYSIISNKELLRRRDHLIENAKHAEECFNLQEAISNYLLAAKISKEIGEFEKSRQLGLQADELRRRGDLLKKKSLKERKIRVDEAKNLDLEREANLALQIAIIAEDECRWTDALNHYEIVVQKNFEMGDIERAKAFQQKIIKIKRDLGE